MVYGRRLEANPLITLLLLIIFFLTGMSGPSGKSTPKAVSPAGGALTGKVIVIDLGHGGPTLARWASAVGPWRNTMSFGSPAT